jgi:hypothetical protein
MYFLRGSLPWQEQPRRRTHNDIMEAKRSSCPTQLCCGYPNEFKEYFDYCLSLSFEQLPDYQHLKELFRKRFFSEGFVDDGMFDWDIQRQTLSGQRSQEPASEIVASHVPEAAVGTVAPEGISLETQNPVVQLSRGEEGPSGPNDLLSDREGITEVDVNRRDVVLAVLNNVIDAAVVELTSIDVDVDGGNSTEIHI